MAPKDTQTPTGTATAQVANRVAPGALDDLNDGVPRLIADQDGKILFATTDFAALCGVEPAALIGRALTSVFTFAEPDDAFHATSMFGARRDDANAILSSLREGLHLVDIQTGHALPPVRGPYQFDRLKMADGRGLIIASGTDGETARNAGLDTDMAARLLDRIAGNEWKTRADDAAAKQGTTTATNAETAHFMAMSSDLMAVSDTRARFTRINPVMAETLGYTESQMQRMGFLDAIHPEDKAMVRNAIGALMTDDAVHDHVIDFECRMLTREGASLWMEWRNKRSGDAIYSVGRNVTAIKKQEDALFRQQQMLREAQAIGHMGHWRWIVGATDIIFSEEIYCIFGVDPEQFHPTLDSVNALLHRRDVGRLLQAFQRAIIEQKPYEMEFRVLRPSGEVRYIRCEGRCENDADGEVISLFGIMQDVTDRTLYERDLHEAKEAAERAYAAKSQFLANMSHELRTPLNAIIGFSEMMQRQLLGPIGSDRYLDYIGGIRESGEHLLDLIADILDMSKIEAGKYELDLEELNVSKVIRLAVHMMEGRATEAKIRVSIDMANEDLQIIADRRAVMQVLLNLLSNAVKFTDAGGSVRVDCMERDDYVLIKVTDTGIGIPANKLKNVTRPFEQAASHYTRKHEGTGLGLAITKELIELHGGTLHIESTVGIGTAVSVRLPYNAYDAMKAQGSLPAPIDDLI